MPQQKSGEAIRDALDGNKLFAAVLKRTGHAGTVCLYWNKWITELFYRGLKVTAAIGTN